MYCDQVLEIRQATFDPSALREAFAARAAALERDNDHDEAVRDWARALEHAEKGGGGPEAIHELRQKQHQAQQQQRQWRERRDHLITLELPANLGQLSPEKQCSWIKKQHRKLVQAHPFFFSSFFRSMAIGLEFSFLF